MELIDINRNWKYVYKTHETSFPLDAEEVDFPVDLAICAERDYHVSGGEKNGYCPSLSAAFFKYLPSLRKSDKIYLEFRGINAAADVYINGEYLQCVSGQAPVLVDITDKYEYTYRNLLKLVFTSPSESGRYSGLGISGGVKLLFESSPIKLEYNSLFIRCVELTDKATLKASVTVTNGTSQPFSGNLEFITANAKGKKVNRKARGIKLAANATKTFDVLIRLRRHYDYCLTDSYIYNLTASLLPADSVNAISALTTDFGINKVALTAKGLNINNKTVKLKGAVVMHDNGVIGKASTLNAEMFKLTKIKELGYNSVRYIGCPSEAALNALDKLGMFAVVDIFDVFKQGNYAYDGHREFDANYLSITASAVKALRNHPCVVMYSLGNNVAECYCRGNGAIIAQSMAKVIRGLDDMRPITSNAFEQTPTRAEIEEAGGKISKLEGEGEMAAINFGREKDLFKSKTSEYFKSVDVLGYSYLYPRYASDKVLGKPIVGLATLPSRVFDANDETDKCAHVIGDFKYSATDYLGEALGKPEFSEEQTKFFPPHIAYTGDLDINYNDKPQAAYRKILNGNRAVSLITVTDPESHQNLSPLSHAVKSSQSLWNWPRHMGQKLDVEVYSGGEVVALYLDGKLVGRKLAGKVNRHIATFKTEYYPGRLEAVSFHKGIECSRVSLESVTAPKSIKLEPSLKSITSGEFSFIKISVCDKEGRVVPFANRDVEVIISGEGSFEALGNADNERTERVTNRICPVHNGLALLAIRGKSEGKVSVKVISDGLLSAKTVIKVKP